MILIFSAPSGSGKSTLIDYLLSQRKDLAFSVSATTRAPRGQEVNGKEYYFITPEEFMERVQNGDFIEYESVYNNTYYGTLHSEIERIEKSGQHVIFDVDVKGGMHLKDIFGDKAHSFFISPPSIETLRERLQSRATDSPEKIAERLAKAETEMTDAKHFDSIIVNNDLEQAKQELVSAVSNFLGEENKTQQA